MKWRAALLLAVSSACPKDSPDPPDAGTTGLRVKLPSGWVARPRGVHALSIGPPGRDVLLLSRWPGAASGAPSQEWLRQLVTDLADGGAWAWRGPTRGARGASGVWLRYRPQQGEGPAGALGARAVGEDLVTCASAPGVSEAELNVAERLCASVRGPDG